MVKGMARMMVRVRMRMTSKTASKILGICGVM